MGERVRAVVADANDLEIGAALEGAGHPGLGTPLDGGVAVTDDLAKALDACDVAIDFSLPPSTLALLRQAARSGTPCVVGTTGFSDAERQEMETLSKQIPLVWAPNFSVAVNVLADLVRRTAELLGTGYDAEIVELHHAAKRDAPSGTALWLGRAVAEGRKQGLDERAVLGRSGDTGARPEGAIGIEALRGGDSPGEHTVMFVGSGERLELTHRAFTRDHFARGAVRAARWLIGRPPGLYGMDRVLDLERSAGR
jgi:4-hydroxy-tetrahydrodipicolinate reductase